jgi:hypothetical protein
LLWFASNWFSYTSEQLDYQPASVFVVEHVRHTYACVHCQGSVTTAPKPAGPIVKGLPGPGLLAHAQPLDMLPFSGDAVGSSLIRIWCTEVLTL